MLRWIFLGISHAATLAIGFALGIYFLPILTAPEGPGKEMLAATAKTALYKAELTRDLKGSDFLHWGEGTISVTPRKVVHEGKLAPGPDYKLYLTTSFVEDEEQFLKLKENARQVGDIKTFDGFIVELPADVDVEKFNTVVVWCESFNEFITAVKYK